MTRHRVFRIVLTAAAIVAGLMLAAPLSVADEGGKVGYFACTDFLDLAGEETSMTQVKLHGSLLRMMGKLDPDLNELVGGLDSIQAVILELDDRGAIDTARKLIRESEPRLGKRGWETLAIVRESGAELRVMVLNDEDVIRGLLVMSLDDEEVVCANIAGILDLAKIAALGEEFDIPGLEDIKKK